MYPVSATGTLYAGFIAVLTVASYFTGDIKDVLTTQWAIVGITTITAAGLLLSVFVPLLALPLFITMKSSNTVIRSIVSGHTNDHAESVERASLLSTTSFVYVVPTLLQPVGGVVADRLSLLWVRRTRWLVPHHHSCGEPDRSSREGSMFGR